MPTSSPYRSVEKMTVLPPAEKSNGMGARLSKPPATTASIQTHPEPCWACDASTDSSLRVFQESATTIEATRLRPKADQET